MVVIAGRRGPALLANLMDAIPEVGLAVDARSATTKFFPVIETYPHPGHIELFGLETILRYKRKAKRSQIESVMAMATYQQHLKDLSHVESSPIHVELLNTDVTTLRGKGYKKHEDLLDSLFCALVAVYLWEHHLDSTRGQVFGDIESGYITIPKLGIA